MELYLQFGDAMRPTCLELLRQWGAATVILSPVDLEGNALTRVAAELTREGAEVLLDVQWYNPHANRTALLTHPWWLQDFQTSTFDSKTRESFVQEIATVNDQVGANRIIVPGRMCKSVDDEWLDLQSDLIETTAKLMPERDRLATICISKEVMLFEDQVEQIVSTAKSWDVQGYYIVAEAPSGYVVRDPTWMNNLLLLCAGLKMYNRSVIVGYCSHQMLALSVARVDAIASGMNLNVRYFDIGRFDKQRPRGGSAQPVWYYCPQALNEYQREILNIAQMRGLFDALVPEAGLVSPYLSNLFDPTRRPTLSRFNVKESRLHYLYTLHAQSLEATRPTYLETLNTQKAQLQRAQNLVDEWKSKAVSPRERDFSDAIDTNLLALDLFDGLQGYNLRSEWK